MADAIGIELRQKLENPIRFQWGGIGIGEDGMPPILLHGMDAGLLIDVCNAVIEAEAKGNLKAARYDRIVRQAHIIVGASAKSGIKLLVYALAGYNPTINEVIAAFKRYVLEEAKKYEPEFPSELYIEWHRLYDIPVLDRGRSWHFKYLTQNPHLSSSCEE